MIRVRRHSVRGSARPSEPAALPVAPPPPPPPRIRPTRDGAPDFAGEHPAELRTAGRVRTDGQRRADVDHPGTAADSNTSRPRSRRACGRSDVRTAGAAPEPRPTCGGAPDFAGEHPAELRTAGRVRTDGRGSAGTAADSNTSRPRSRRACGRSDVRTASAAPGPRPTCGGAPDFAGEHRPGSGRLEHLHGRGRDPRAAARDRGRFRNGASRPDRTAAGRPEELRTAGRVRTDGQRRADVDHPGTAADSNTSRPRSRRACGRSDVRTAGAAPEPRPTCGGAPDFAGEHPAELRTAGRVRTDGRGSAGTAADRTPQGRARGARAAGPTSGRPAPRRDRGRRAAARQTSPANTARAAADSNTCTAAAVIRGRPHGIAAGSGTAHQGRTGQRPGGPKSCARPAGCAAPQRQRLCTAIRACRPTRSTPPDSADVRRRARLRRRTPCRVAHGRPGAHGRPAPRRRRPPRDRGRLEHLKAALEGARAAGPTSGRPGPRRDRAAADSNTCTAAAVIRVRRHSVRGSARPSEPAALPVAPPRIRPTCDGAPDFAGEHPAELRTAGRVRTDGRGRAGTGQRPTRTPAHGRGRDPRAAPQRQRLCTAIRACRPTRSTPPDSADVRRRARLRRRTPPGQRPTRTPARPRP